MSFDIRRLVTAFRVIGFALDPEDFCAAGEALSPTIRTMLPQATAKGDETSHWRCQRKFT